MCCLRRPRADARIWNIFADEGASGSRNDTDSTLGHAEPWYRLAIPAIMATVGMLLSAFLETRLGVNSCERVFKALGPILPQELK